MKAYATFRRHPCGEVVPHTNEDRDPLQVAPFDGRFGAGVWTGHPIGLFICAGLIVMGLIGLPEWRWFFGATVLMGSLVGYFLWRHQTKA